MKVNSHNLIGTEGVIYGRIGSFANYQRAWVMHRFLGMGVSVFISCAATAASDPQSIDMGGGKLIPTLSVTFEHDDNIFSQPNNEVSDTKTVVRPEVQWIQESEKRSLAVTYTGDYGLFWDSDDDDYDDHTVSLDAMLSPTDLFRAKVGASYGWLHDGRGEGGSEGINALARSEPDEYEISTIGVNLDFGRESAMFGAELDLSEDRIQYSNNRNETIFRDRDDSYWAGRLYTRLSGGKTKIFVQVSENDITYDNDPLIGGVLDSTEQGVSVGVEWEATARTSGSIRIGEIDKEFDSVGRQGSDTSVSNWEATVVWAPRTYSTFSLTASRAPNETNGTGDFIDARSITLGWNHSWTDRISTAVAVTDGADTFIGDASGRDDDRQVLSLGLNYNWRRWISVGANYTYTERESDINLFDMQKNVFAVTVDMSL